ncbi:MAG: TlpA family protein disulfide reductase [Oscillospiraceae bacterium]|nr:TlpA family protein disulfide reductase [Oscillospiraceae bacterium]
MNKTKKILLAVAAFSLIFLAGCDQILAMIPPRDLNPLPDFSVVSVIGGTVTREDLLGTPTMVVFWNSWCQHCNTMMPHVQEIYNEFGSQVRVMAINVREDHRTDGDQVQALQNAIAYLGENGFNFPVYFDWDLEAYNAMQAPAVPTTVFIDATGYATRWRLGARTLSQLRRDLQEIL